MQTTLAPRARRSLLVAGVLTVALTALAPAAVSASPSDDLPVPAGAPAGGQGGGGHDDGGPGHEGQGHGAGGLGRGEDQAGGGAGQGQGQEGGVDRVTICHGTASDVNPSVEITVGAPSLEQGHGDHHDDDHGGELGDDLECDSSETTGLEQGAAVAGQGDGNGGGNGGGNGDGNGGGNGNGGSGSGAEGGSAPEAPAGADPVPPAVEGDEEVAAPAPTPPTADPRPTLPTEISSDTVDRRAPEVLGSVTTRTPTGDTTVATSLTSLPRTGTDSVRLLGLLGGMLLLAGVGLELLARRSAPLAGARQG